MSIYDFNVKAVDGSDVSLADYQGKVLLIVNTATACGYTPQYAGLEDLYQKYQEQGFEILDFPCNQFKNQAPGSNEEIQEFCQLKYHTTFQTFAKIDVNGPTADPLYQYLKKAQTGVAGSKIKWNFTKFLVDREGNVVGREAPIVAPKEMESAIEGLL